MKTVLRTVKLIAAFWLLLAAGYFAWVTNIEEKNIAVNKDKPTLICITMAAIGLSILWMDWRKS